MSSQAKKEYKKPVIVKVQTQLSSKHGAASKSSNVLVRENIDGVSIEKLTSKYGSPLYVFSEKRLKEIYKRNYKAFSERYPKVCFAWSYKTNYLKSICSLFHKFGSIAEVVSEFEYDKARKLGVKGENIIFNGPYKPIPALEKAVKDGAKIHVDSFDEISDLEEVADKLKTKISVAIRINLDAGIYPQWSRFGFNLESGQAADAVERIKAGGKLKINGLHCHIGTFILDATAYSRAIDKLIAFADKMKKSAGFKLEYLDMGGGFASKSHLKGVYQPPEIAVPDVEAYADQITSALYRNCDKNDLPMLYLETGRAMVDEAGFLISSIVASKNMVTGQRAYTMDAGVNLLYTSTWYNYKVEIDRYIEGILEPAVLNGPLCMNIDVVEENMLLPRLERGTRLIISPIGAYNATQSMQFIHCRPAVVMISEDGSVEVIREKEKLEDIEINECLPKKFDFKNK
jgi:diaminopimelate decarboxylase